MKLGIAIQWSGSAPKRSEEKPRILAVPIGLYPTTGEREIFCGAVPHKSCSF